MAEFLRLKLIPLEKKLKVTQSKRPCLETHTHTQSQRSAGVLPTFQFHVVIISSPPLSLSS